MVATAKEIPSERSLMVIGQAGDRDDDSIRAIANSAARLNPERFIIKDMVRYRRGRKAGVVPALIESALRASGAEQIFHAGSELDAVEMALEWAREGDLLVLPTHESREEVLAKVRAFVTSPER